MPGFQAVRGGRMGAAAGALLLAAILAACAESPATRSPAAPPKAPASAADPPRAPVSAPAVEEELERIVSGAVGIAGIAGRSFWPGFDPLAIPLALYDGENTWLFRHPHPPPEFGPGPGGARIADGRSEALRANTGTEIGGVATATLLLSGGTARSWAATAVHEAFHVFQKQHHPGWAGDEMELFVYPLEDREGLALRREETQALRRALAAARESDAAGMACWADLAVRLREERFARLPPEAVAYERGTELNEGLATYVEGLARGETGMDLPADDFPAEKLRERAYAVGRAQAVLLDRLGSPWKERLGTEGQPGSLDALLAAELAGREGPRPCALTAAERAAAARRAGEDLERLRQERASARAAFLGKPGWTVVVIAGGAGSAGDEPLWPQNFDPWNVLRLNAGEVLHRHWLKVGNGTAEFEVLDREALTQAVGPHPLLQGVKRLTVTGLAEKPEVKERGGWARLEAKGFTAKLRSARISITSHELRIELSAAPHPPSGPPPAAAAAPRRARSRPTSTG